jgi:hypothetical protein
MSRTRVLSFVILLLLVVAVAGCVDRPGAEPGATPFAGTWRASGSVMTTSMLKQGEFRMRIRPDGRYSLVSAPGGEFVIDGGRFTELDTARFIRLTAAGAEDRGTVVRAGSGWRLSGTWGALDLQPVPPDAAQDEALDRVAAVFALEGLRSVAGWTARAQQLALLWRPDAQLTSVSVVDFDANGLLQSRSTLSMVFQSPNSDRALLLAPVRTELPAFFASENRLAAAAPGRAIPVPIRDLQELVGAVRATGSTQRLVNARLQFFDESGRGAQLLWMVDVAGSMQRWCMTATQGEIVDCRVWAGDPEAEYEALARRAAEGWRALQQHWSGAAGGGTGLSAMDRCMGVGATWRDGACYSFWQPDQTLSP